MTLALFAALAIGHTWPLGAAPGRYHRHDNMDTPLNEWIMAWVGHQVVRDPINLFNAPIFHPEPHTLAFSEHLFVQGVMALPLYWAGASPVTAFNVILIAGLALTGWTTCLVVRRWTGSWLAGIVAGSLIAFNANTLTRLVHIQAVHLQFFPLMLLALDNLLRQPRLRHALASAGWFVLQALTSVHFLVFSAMAGVAAALTRPRDWMGARALPLLKYAAIGAIVALVLLAPFTLPYMQARQEQAHFTRLLSDVAQFSASWPNYLAAAGTLHRETLGWSQGYASADYLFPGVAAILLTLAALVSLTAFRDVRARMALGFGVVSFALSFGPAFPLYEFLFYAFPPLQGIRGAARFGQMVLASMALLAGFGLAWVMSRLPARAALATGLIAIAAVNAEAWRAPIGYCGTPGARCGPFTGLDPIFKSLDRDDVKAIVVLPFPAPRDFMHNAMYMLDATAHFKPMLNGYSGYRPPSLETHAKQLADFPSFATIDYLHGLGVTHVVLNAPAMAPVMEAVRTSPALSLDVRNERWEIYTIRPR